MAATKSLLPALAGALVEGLEGEPLSVVLPEAPPEYGLRLLTSLVVRVTIDPTREAPLRLR